MKYILIIDDNLHNYRDAINKVMDKDGYCTTTCGNLKRAYDILQERKYDVVVIDIMMPCPTLENKNEMKAGLNFYEEKVKHIDDIKDTKILFWSNLCSDSFDQFFKKGKPENVDFLHKDRENDNHLLEKIESMLSQKQTKFNPTPTKMTKKEFSEIMDSMGYGDSITFSRPSYFGAIVGYSDTGQVCYDYNKMIECLMEDDKSLSYEDAMEFIDYNTVRALPYCTPSDKRPIIIYPILD